MTSATNNDQNETDSIDNADAVDLAAEETEFPLSTFPTICPYTQQQLLNKFYPITSKIK